MNDEDWESVDLEGDSEMRMFIDRAKQETALSSHLVPTCPHLGAQSFGIGKARWCPDCYRMFGDGNIMYGDQHEEGKWVMIVPPSVMDQMRGLLEEDEE